ncbi:putative invertase inhibitor [Ananas comosus]|uniref:Invertase inhibitor n=1 Tax=Ananas comosus TaxID=4615 RepID=A0A6P5EI63_ANACO|nr:putative invertase inhibitor [Ananas comosus]
MKPFNVLPLPLFLLSSLLLAISSSADLSFLENTCRRVATASPAIGYDFCVRSLRSDKESLAAADLAALAVVAARIANAAAAGTESRIKCMIESELNPSKRDRLGVCDEVYSDAIDRIRDAVRSIEAGLYSDAVTFLSAALDASENCEDAFGEGAEDDGSAAAPPSPLEREDGEYERLAEIALAITAWLV